jgi:antitoxin HicB
MNEVAIRLQIERLEEGVYLATSTDVPGLVAEGRTIAEAIEIAQDLTRRMVECWLEHGDPLPPALRGMEQTSGTREFMVPVGLN